MLDGLLAGKLTYDSQQQDASSAFLQSMSHDDEAINFVTLSDLRGCNAKSWAKEHCKIQTNPSLGPHFDIRLAFYFREAQRCVPRRAVISQLAASYGSDRCVSALAQNNRHATRTQLVYPEEDLTTQASGGEEGQEELTTGPTSVKFDHAALQGENYWKAMKGDEEKEKTFSNSVQHFKRGGRKY